MVISRDMLPIVSNFGRNLEPDSQQWKTTSELETKTLNLVKQFANKGATWLFLEPITGPRGIRTYRSTFMAQLRNVCDEHKILIVADEVLTGNPSIYCNSSSLFLIFIYVFH
jgi:4-aminobutyrate aminotransferase-like enzyme